MFHLTYYGGISYREVYNMPVAYKRWLSERIVREISKRNGDSSNDSQASPVNPSLLGVRDGSPDHLRRA
jgi:hypothetical protein